MNEVMCVGREDGNVRAARELYRRRFIEGRPEAERRQLPSVACFHRMVYHLHQTGSFHAPGLGGRPNTIDPEFEEAVLEHFENNPRTSTRRAALALDASNHMQVWRVLPNDGQQLSTHTTSVAPRSDTCRFFASRYLLRVVLQSGRSFARFCFVVITSNHIFKNENSKMLRGINKVFGHKGHFLEPYVTAMHLSCNLTSANPQKNVQNLPRLPVPKLNDTLKKYLLTVRPFLNDEEFARTTALVKDFEKGSGRQLQALLEKRAQEHLNWLEDWWLNTAYLEYRDPVVVYSNPGLVFPFRKFQSQNEQLKYAAQTLLAAMEYKSIIDNEKMPVEMMGKNPLDMGQYKKIFGTCRIPHEKRDKLSFNNSKHVTVIHNNNIFHVDLWGEDNVLLNEDQIIQQLKKVIETSSSPNNEGIGILTSENRDNWAQAYQLLAKDKTNRESLADIEKSLFVLCLDKPVDLWKAKDANARRNIAGAQTIHGGGSRSNGANRWFDKTVQFIVGADGVTGLTYEHSPAEGQPIAVLTDFIIKYIEQNKASETSSSSPKQPTQLKFNVTADVSRMIDNAKKNLDGLVKNLQLNCFQYDKYGKNFIKSQKLSPDSYLQMAMQLAFYRLHKVPGAHYESAATRMYVGGRTETIRSCSIESIDFAKTMLNSQSSPKDKISALKDAINSHKNYTVQALQGLGVDRHLLGLKLTAIENGIEIPQIYSDPGFKKSSYMRISTSQVACKCDGFMCYGPLVPDGYATCYNPRDNDINFATSAFVEHPDTDCNKYRNALEQSLQDMHDVLLKNVPSKL